jgi:hypothetical protein
LNIPELNILLECGKIKRLRDVNLDGFAREQVDGYIHPMFNLHLVKTYRSSSSNPNFQNIPIRDEESMQVVRQALYARPGHQLMEIDTSGMEVRIAATYHKDPTMLKYIRNPKSDMHGDMAKQIYLLDKLDKDIPSHKVLRYGAKNGFVFPEFYGDYYKNCAIGLCDWGELPQGRWHEGEGIEMPQGTLSDHLISKGLKEFGEIKKVGNKIIVTGFLKHIQDIEYDFWNNRFPVYAEWKNRWWRAYLRNGYFDLSTGFRCRGIMNLKEVINYPVQGAAFHCLLWGFIEVDKTAIKEHWDSRLVGQIHDSLVLDVLSSEAEYIYKTIRRIMCEELPAAWDWINVPIDIDCEISPVDSSWAEKQKFELKN